MLCPIIENLTEYLLANHMYSELSEVRQILGKEKADKSTRSTYILGAPAFYGLYDIVDFLIARGFDVNAVNQRNGVTALHEAAVSGEEKIVKLLLHHKADITTRDKLGDTPLDKAIYFSRKCVVELFSTNA